MRAQIINTSFKRSDASFSPQNSLDFEFVCPEFSLFTRRSSYIQQQLHFLCHSVIFFFGFAVKQETKNNLNDESYLDEVHLPQNFHGLKEITALTTWC